MICQKRKFISELKFISIQLTNWFSTFANSLECASFNFNTFRANSMTEHCKPKQIPKNGFLFSLAHSHAFIFPSTPLIPKPPAIKIPLK